MELRNQNVYELGSVVKLIALFYDEDGELADPSTILLEILFGDETTTITEGIENPSVGTYHYYYTPDAVGQYYYRYVGTGDVTASDQKPFYIRSVLN